MKKIVVMSDNHGDEAIIPYILENESDADAYIHLGDSEFSDLDLLEGFICVSGNNDWEIDLPRGLIVDIEDLKFLLMHGQNFGYFDKQERMYQVLVDNECDVLLSGHTHMPDFEEYKDKIFINPGSTSWPRGGSNPSYAVLYVDKKYVDCKFVNLEF